jgi:hypothetical protein
MRLLVAIAVLLAAVCGAAPEARAEACDTDVTSIVRGFLARRDAGDYRALPRYLTSRFEASFRAATGRGYFEYIGDPDVTWRDTAVASSLASESGCTLLVRTTRTADGTSATVNETYTAVRTEQGWRIDAWEWQPADQPR